MNKFLGFQNVRIGTRLGLGFSLLLLMQVALSAPEASRVVNTNAALISLRDVTLQPR